MNARVTIYEVAGHPRSSAVCRAFEQGLRRLGESVERVGTSRYRRPESEIAVFYGAGHGLRRIFQAYSADKDRHAVYIDLGWWKRKNKTRFDGYHKISVDARHPTAYFQRTKHDGKRLAALGVTVADWVEQTATGHILIAGMGPKGAQFEGYGAGAWETAAVRAIQQCTKRRILYRPKPNWASAKPIAGTQFSIPGRRSLEEDLRGAHAIVSHHSNANVEALALGVPSFTTDGVASVLSMSDLTRIEKPRRKGDREQFLRDVSYQQWNLDEMAAGLPWRYLRDTGVIP